MLSIIAHMSLLSPVLAATASLTVSELLAAVSLQLDNLERQLEQDDREGFQEGVAGINELMRGDIEIRELKEAGPLEELNKWLRGFRQLAANYLAGQLPADEALSDLRFLLNVFPVVPEEEINIDVDTDAFEEAGADPARVLEELTAGAVSAPSAAVHEVILDWTNRTAWGPDDVATDILQILRQAGPHITLSIQVARGDRAAFERLGFGIWLELKKRVHGLDEGQVILIQSPSLKRQVRYNVLQSESHLSGYGGFYIDFKFERMP